MNPTCRLAAALALLAASTAVPAATPAELLEGYRSLAGTPAQPGRGRDLYAANHGRPWSCASCHGPVPTQAGRHASTGKPIAPLAPAAEARRFTDPAKVEKWFRRNCGDVLGRACTPGEKADLLAWLISTQP